MPENQFNIFPLIFGRAIFGQLMKKIQPIFVEKVNEFIFHGKGLFQLPAKVNLKIKPIPNLPYPPQTSNRIPWF